ncbi:WD40 repeat-like protein, partial [Lizonia empirigonia]
KTKGSGNWNISSAQGGWFLPRDPVFSADEKFIILGTQKALEIYVAETSLLAYKLPVSGSGEVTAYAMSATDSSRVYVAESTGLITLWDWVSRQKIGRWDIGATVRNMTVITHSDEDLVYCHEPGKSHIINVHALRTGAQASTTELKPILKTSSSILDIQVLLQGNFVVVACNDSLMVGKRQKQSKTAVQDFEYVWRELKFSQRITAFNAYVRDPTEVTGKAAKSAQDQRDVIDIAVGEESGVILLFEDVLSSFAAIETIQKGGKAKADNAESLRPKKLHWHRDAVGSVKWSLDGNYVVSGGDETVITIWQLATGKPQHLPHLTAAIENIVVSPSGSSYGITLANNSVIVLSTTELEAKTNIVGIQSRRIEIEQLPRNADAESPPASYDIFQSVPLVTNPMNPAEVMFSVPSSQPRHRSEGLRPEPYLQTYDLANQHTTSKQALTRNNATDPNLTPEGRRILEPTVILVQISHDGEWLATVDEWTPPEADTSYLDEGIPEFKEEERIHRREVYLKIWRRDVQSGQWKLETRLDAPHFFQDISANGKVFDLIADPTAPGFATVGEDHFVRVWRPKTRLRDGLTVRGAEKQGLVTWTLDCSVEISDKLDVLDAGANAQQTLPLRNSRLAFSADGSVIAAAISWASDEDPGVVHLIDANTTVIQRSLTEVDVVALSGLAILDRHLIVVGDSITVWDMVRDQLVYCVPINTPGIDRFDRIPLVKLATNEIDSTFAVSLPRFENSNARFQRASSTTQVYKPQQLGALWSSKNPAINLALASRHSERGYVTLDSAANIRVISPTSGTAQLPTPPPEEVAQHVVYAQAGDVMEAEE